MFSHLSGKLNEAKQRVVIMAHRDELLTQISKTLADFDVRHGMTVSGEPYDERMQCHVASVATLFRRITRCRIPDYVIVDEAHHGTAASMYGKILAAWRDANPRLRVIGVTATPQRLSGEGLGESFDDLVLGPTTAELIDCGALAPYRMFAPSVAVDLSGVHLQAGDFNRKEVAAAMDKPAIVGNVIGEYSKRLNGAPSVAFCVSVEHAERTAESFRSSGFRAVAIDGRMDKTLRRDIVRDFSRGQINVLTSCDLISEGFDVPGIVGALLLRPTWSLAMYLQQVGRALRTAPGKDAAIILDHVGNSGRHGMPDDPREWSLMGRGRSSKSDADPSARQCEKCFAASPAAASKCRECGHPFPVKPRVIDEVAGELTEIEIERARREAAREQASAQTIEALTDLGRMRGMKNPAGWARHVVEAREKKAASRGFRA